MWTNQAAIIRCLYGARKMTNRREVSIETVRDLARHRSEQRSLRYVADQIGVGASTLHNFLRGAMPHPRIRHKLAEWYVRELGSGRDAFPDEAYFSAVQLLVAGLPADGRENAADDVVSLLEELHERRGLPKPPWLERLRSGEELPRLV
jgi:hypothetical protein